MNTDLSRYRHLARLGAGGMATVSLAEDEVLGRKVALKRLSLPITADEDDGRLRKGISRMRREALLGASVSHPNLVSIYDIVTEDDGNLVIVMEYVPGETLAAKMSREGRIAPEAALTILEGIAAGLDAIHRQGIVHRDLKPANVLLREDGAVKLADFGIAIEAAGTRITSAGAVVGTFRYMAPEQLEDAPSTPAMDIYAFAVTAFEMLSGEKARPESNPVALAHAIATQPAPDLRAACPGTPRAAAQLLRDGMAKDPAVRPRSAGELVERLREALPEAPTRRIEPPAPEPLRPTARPAGKTPAAGPAQDWSEQTLIRPRPRRRLPLLLGAAALVAVIAAAAIILASGSGPGSHAGTHAAQRSAAAPARHRRQTTSTASRGTTDAGAASTASTPASTSVTSAPPAAASGPAASGPAASGPAASGPGGRGAAASTTAGPAAAPGSAPAGAGTPAAAVESFYHAAAAHQFTSAWALADDSFRAQLGDFASFSAGQAADRSIRFSSASVTAQTASTATVAVATTSVRTSGTQHCTGTVDLSRSGAGPWLLHQIHISCA